MDIESFVEEAYELQTGARGLYATMGRAVEVLAFENFGLSCDTLCTKHKVLRAV